MNILSWMKLLIYYLKLIFKLRLEQFSAEFLWKIILNLYLKDFYNDSQQTVFWFCTLWEFYRFHFVIGICNWNLLNNSYRKICFTEWILWSGNFKSCYQISCLLMLDLNKILTKDEIQRNPSLYHPNLQENIWRMLCIFKERLYITLW